jgi:hypothetical protein
MWTPSSLGIGEQGSLHYGIAWPVLLLLTGFSLLSAFLHLGLFAPFVQFGVAATYAANRLRTLHRVKGPAIAETAFCRRRMLMAVVFFTGSA